MARISTSYQKLKAAEASGKVVLDFFVYGSNISALAAAASQAVNIAVEADSSFILDKIAFIADIAGAVVTDSTRVIPLVTMAIQDTGSGRSLQNLPIPLSSIGGNGQLPFVLPQPRVFTANSTISLTFTNFSAATTYNLRVSLIGRKVFAY